MTASLLLFVVVYCAVFGTGIAYLLRLVATGPGRGVGTGTPADSDRPGQRPARPLSAVPKLDASPSAAGE
jgi:cytochrome d ubiquinol oxidase subunit I